MGERSQSIGKATGCGYEASRRLNSSRLGMFTLAIAMLSASDGSQAGSACAPVCRTHHNACRVETKGSVRCDSELQDCITRCMAASPSETANSTRASTRAQPLPAGASSLLAQPPR